MEREEVSADDGNLSEDRRDMVSEGRLSVALFEFEFIDIISRRATRN